jgi:para-nitrobenzyl esterase
VLGSVPAVVVFWDVSQNNQFRKDWHIIMLKRIYAIASAGKWAGLSVVALACLGVAVVPLHAATFPQTVQVDTGTVNGIPGANPAVMAFKGIPFAAPPVGALRWKPPVTPAKWSGELKADHFGPSCTQPTRRVPIPGSQNPTDVPGEDCLYLNVWTPAKSAAEKLPVMVWIYGGGFSGGSGSNADFDGEGLAAKGIVRITFNYRLGILGFLAHPDLDKESAHHTSGNYGMLDQIAVLQWVARNIAAFGGDPKNVTIFGQSAGGGSVHFLANSPLAKGLFHRAISENGLMHPDDPFLQERSPSAYKKFDQAEADNLAYLKKAGIESLQKLRAMSAAEILALPRAPFPPAFFTPVVNDGWVFPNDFAENYAQKKQNDVPFMAGWTSVYYPELKIAVAEYRNWAEARFGAMAKEYLSLYPATTDEEASMQVEQGARDSYRASLLLWSKLRQKNFKTYIYYFNHGLPGDRKEKFGAGAGAEIPYVMNSLSKTKRAYKQQDYDIAEMMSSYWANFAKTGDPNGKGLPVWSAVSPDGKIIMQLGDNTGKIPVATDARLDFYKRFFATHPRCAWGQGCSINMP